MATKTASARNRGTAPDIEVSSGVVDTLMSGNGSLVWARRPFDYADDAQIDRGQYFRLRNYRNDEKLLRLGHVEKVDGDSVNALECSECGGLFIDDFTRGGHVKHRHPNFWRKRNPIEEDQDADRQERMLEAIAPLYMEKTVATR